MLKPSPGEAADRQTILHLKLDHADTQSPTDEFELATQDVDAKPVVKDGKTLGAVGRTVNKGASKIDVQPFLWEHEELQQYLEKTYFVNYPDAGKAYDKLFDELKEINSRLWNLEDEARTLRQLKISVAPFDNAAVYRAAVVLCEITQANDERAETVKKINALFGISQQEKMYATS